jgi:hypothetical protein
LIQYAFAYNEAYRMVYGTMSEDNKRVSGRSINLFLRACGGMALKKCSSSKESIPASRGSSGATAE